MGVALVDRGDRAGRAVLALRRHRSRNRAAVGQRCPPAFRRRQRACAGTAAWALAFRRRGRRARRIDRRCDAGLQPDVASRCDRGAVVASPAGGTDGDLRRPRHDLGRALARRAGALRGRLGVAAARGRAIRRCCRRAMHACAMCSMAAAKCCSRSCGRAKSQRARIRTTPAPAPPASPRSRRRGH